MSEKIKIGIVGLGLIGGSIEKRLKQKPEKFEVLVVSHSQAQGLDGSGNRRELKDLADVDILFLCSSQSQILKQLEEISLIILQSSDEGRTSEEKRAFAHTIISDVGSTKERICQAAAELGLSSFIGGHPMAGTEHQGYEASFPELFEGATWILTESSERTELLEQVIKQDLAAANLVVMDAVTHDQCAAAISHVPLLLSLGLGNLIRQVPTAKNIIGPGFTGMARLAKGNEQLSSEIIKANNKNIKELWQLYKQQVDSLLEISGESLVEEMGAIKQALTV